MCGFKVTYQVSVLKPTIGSIYTTVVNNTNPYGVLAKTGGIEFIIPSESLRGCHISRGDWIKVKVTCVRYNDEKYQCIGDLII
jgi:non-ribosomal peptide synthetase component F